MLERRQVLEEKKFRLKQEEAPLNLEVKIAKSAAKEHAQAALSPSPSDNLPLRPLEPKPEVRKEDVAAPVIREFNYSECSGESHNVPPRANAHREDIVQDNIVFAANPDRFIACDDYQKEALAFQRQQTALQVQQNGIVELLAVNQYKSRLPQPRVPMFDGNPVEYHSFIQAFENLIESRTQSSTESNTLVGLSKSWYGPVIICRLRKDTSKHVGFSCVNLERSTGLPLHMNRRRWHGLKLSQKTARLLASLLSFFPVVRTLWAAVCTHQSLTSQETFRNWFSNYRFL